jgi:hypothetical protein
MVTAGRDAGGGDGIGAATGGSFDAAGGLGAGALAAAFEAADDDLPPRLGLGGGAGAGGGDSTIVGSRSLPVSRARPDDAGAAGSGAPDCVRGTLGKPPARGEVRDSGAAAAESPEDEPDDDEEEEDEDAGAVPRSVRRVSRCGPGQSQIERGDSLGALVEVANAGVRPGNAGALGAPGALGGGAALADDACAAALPDVIVISGSSLIASPFSSPVEASVGLPS